MNEKEMREKAEALAGPHQPWRTQGGDYTCPALLLGKNPCSCGQAQRVEEILALLEKADKLKLLQDAVNESDEPCLPTCDSHAHDDECPHISMAASLSKQCRTIKDLEAKVRELEAEVQNQIALKVGLAGQLAVALTSDGRYDEGRKAGLEEGAREARRVLSLPGGDPTISGDKAADAIRALAGKEGA